MSIAMTLAEWDGKTTALLHAVYEEHGTSQRFMDDLLSLLAQPELQVAVTWLIKHRCEEQGILSPKQTRLYLTEMIRFYHWEARLHALQVFPYFQLEEDLISQVEAYLMTELTHKNKLVRAWAYNALYLLGEWFFDCRNRLRALLIQAFLSESGAVKARLRNQFKKKEGWLNYSDLE